MCVHQWKKTSFQIVRSFPISANLLIQSTGHVYLVCVLCSGMPLIFCEQIYQHFICCWVHEFIEGQLTLMLAADWIDTSIITNSFLFWQLEHYWLPSDSFNLVMHLIRYKNTMGWSDQKVSSCFSSTSRWTLFDL